MTCGRPGPARVLREHAQSTRDPLHHQRGDARPLPRIFEKAAERACPSSTWGSPRASRPPSTRRARLADMLREASWDRDTRRLTAAANSAATANFSPSEVVRQASNSLTARSSHDWASDARFFIHGYFARRRRAPRAAASARRGQRGRQLDIKPELSYDLNGALTLRGMCRGRKKALRAIIRTSATATRDPRSALPSSRPTPRRTRTGSSTVRGEGCEDVTVIRSSVSPILGTPWGRAWWPSSSGAPTAAKLSLTDPHRQARAGARKWRRRYPRCARNSGRAI